MNDLLLSPLAAGDAGCSAVLDAGFFRRQAGYGEHDHCHPGVAAHLPHQADLTWRRKAAARAAESAP